MIYDINLLPKRKNKVSGKTLFTIFSFIILGIGVLAFFGIYLPLNMKNQLSDKIKRQQRELQTYTANDVQFIELTEQINNLKQMISALDELKNNRFQGTKILDSIEESIPKNIVVESISLESNLLTLEALSPSYREIAQFVVKAREIEKVLDVKFTNAYLQPDTEEQAGNKELYRFQIFITLDAQDLITVLEQGSTEAESGNGEVDGNEAN